MIIIQHLISIIIGLFIADDLRFLINSDNSLLIFWIGFFALSFMLKPSQRTALLISSGAYLIISSQLIPYPQDISIKKFLGTDVGILISQHNKYTLQFLLFFTPVMFAFTNRIFGNKNLQLVYT